MKHFTTLDLVELKEDTGSVDMERILAVTEMLIEVGDTFYIGNYPSSGTAKTPIKEMYVVDFVNDIVEVDFLHYNIKASKTK